MELRDADKSREQLIHEMQELRRQLAQLEPPAAGPIGGTLPSELALLMPVSAASGNSETDDDSLQLIAEELRRLLDVRASVLWLLDDESGEPARRSSAGPAAWHGSLGEDVAGWVARSGESLSISGPATGEAGASALTLPLRAGRHVIGALELSDAGTAGFDREFLDRAQPLADMAALGIELAQRAADHGRLSKFLFDALRSPRMWVTLVDRDARVLLWNSFAETLAGYTEDETLGHADVWEWLLPDEAGRAALLADMRHALVSQEALETALSVVRVKSGRRRTIAWTGVPLAGESGAATGLLLLGQDVTDQLREETTLRRTAERLAHLREIDLGLLSARTPAQVAEAVAAHLPALIPAHWVGVVTIDMVTEQITDLLADSETGLVAGTRIEPPWEPAFLETLEQGEQVLERLADLDMPAEARQALVAANVGAVWIYPLVADDALIGALYLGTEGGSDLAAEDLTLVREVAGLLGNALQRSILFDRMSEDRQRLQRLSRRLLARQEEERDAVARELHDEIGQTLAGLKMGWDAAARAPADQVAESLGDWRQVTNDLLARVRELSSELRPTMLDDLGLVPALLWLFEHSARQTGVAVSFTHAGAERRFGGELETAFYRIAQECLSNAAQHAGVEDVVVHLWVEADALHIRVSDDGVGFEPASVIETQPAGGLAGMIERATLLGGYVTIESEPGAGTTVTARAPLRVGPQELPGEPCT